jgi:hypothetical protein
VSDPGIIRVPKPDQRPGHVGREAVVPLALPEAAHPTADERGLRHPVLARLPNLGDLARRAEVGEGEHVPMCPEEAGLHPTPVAHPPARRVPAGEYLPDPRVLGDLRPSGTNLRVGSSPSLQLGQCEKPHRRLARLEQPGQDRVGRHGRPEDQFILISSEPRRGAGCEEGGSDTGGLSVLSRACSSSGYRPSPCVASAGNAPADSGPSEGFRIDRLASL